ncbi:MAG TPA: HAMP domain-containing sensor histidine kinase [Solirubrobacteraceae bacterium]|jgi:signal transduction histidine kinase
MSAVGAYGGWLVAAVALALWGQARWQLAACGEGVLRACHELRGPLTAVRLGVQLGARTGRLSPSQWRAIEGELDRAALALGDLQGARRRRAAPLASGAVDLRALLSDSVEAWRPQAAAAGVTLELAWAGGHSRVRGDRVRLAQATGNLIANAIEHGGGRVEVRGRRWGGGASIEVRDDGPGLPASVTELTRGARRRGGRGRGLAIVAGVAEAHGGRLADAGAWRPCGPQRGGAAQGGHAQGTCLVLELPDRAAQPGRSA